MNSPLHVHLEKLGSLPWRQWPKYVGPRFVANFPWVPLPLRLPCGAWWLARNDICSKPILAGIFENDEVRFVDRLLHPGMTVFDVGAHHGYYTLLASKKVGPRGRVVAFEPSARERFFLSRHLRINRCQNVTVEALALGSRSGEENLFVMDGPESGLNSLRVPYSGQPSKVVRVSVSTLDDYMEQTKIERIDFVKLDVEGGELGILRGAARLLRQVPRPIFLVEVQDIRSEPWGYQAREIISLLVECGFVWHRFIPGGGLEKMINIEEKYDGNFVAVPSEKLDSFVVQFSQ